MLVQHLYKLKRKIGRKSLKIGRMSLKKWENRKKYIEKIGKYEKSH